MITSLTSSFRASTRLSRRGARVAVAVALIVTATATASLPASAGDPVEEAEARRDAASRAANEAAQRYDEATAHYYELDARIATTQAQLEAVEADAARVRNLASDRAIEAYTGGRAEFDTIIASGDVLDAVRRSEMLRNLNQRSDDAVDRLDSVSQDLGSRKDDLADQLSQQKAVLEEVHALEVELRDKLAEAEAAYQAELEAKAQRDAAAARTLGAVGEARTSGRSGQILVNPGGGGFVCPVQGAVAFSDTWGAPRSGGRRHQGVDMMAATGTPVVAVVGGSISQGTGGLAGLSIWLHGNNGTTYFYAHLSEFVGGSRSVSAGELIGRVGNTGNASGGPSHLHFEIHPGGGGAINPTPTVATYC